LVLNVDDKDVFKSASSARDEIVKYLNKEKTMKVIVKDNYKSFSDSI